MRRTPLQRKTPLRATGSLERATPLRRSTTPAKRRHVSPATPAQRARVKDRACIVCGAHPCDPAHVVDRSLAPSAGDNPAIIVPLCRPDHESYDSGDLDLTPYLEPHWRDAAAAAVEAVGLVRALNRISKRTWVIMPSEEVA